MQIPQETRKHSRKIDPRAEISILVGYEGEHIYVVWIPSTTKGRGRLVRSSNVVFDEYATYNGNKSDQFNSDIQSKSRGDNEDDNDFDQNIFERPGRPSQSRDPDFQELPLEIDPDDQDDYQDSQSNTDSYEITDPTDD